MTALKKQLKILLLEICECQEDDISASIKYIYIYIVVIAKFILFYPRETWHRSVLLPDDQYII